MKLLRLLLQSAWHVVLLSVLAGLVCGASSAGLIALINARLSTAAPDNSLAWGFVGLSLILLLSSSASQVLISRVVQKVIADLRLRLSQRILASPLRQLEEIGAPCLLSTLTEDVGAISFASSSLATLGINIALLLGCLTYLTWLLPASPSLFGLLFLIFGIWSYALLENRGNQYFKLARNEQDRLFHHFQTITQGTKELQLHQQRRRAFTEEDLQPSIARSQRYQVAALDWFAIATSWGLLLFFIPIGLFLFTPIANTVLSAATLSSYALTIIFMISPLTGLLYTLPELNRANIALQKIESLGLILIPLTRQGTDQVASHSILLDRTVPSPEWHCLQLSAVIHTYPSDRDDRQFTLGPIDLTLYPGELVFIVGGNGSGKSTLIKLITGLYTPEAGRIQLDHCVITEQCQEWYRQQFSAVFSDFYLFDRLLGLENLALEQQAQTYLQQLHLETKVTIQSGTFSTTLLSQGQRKRLALLTAYLENRPIYVFDEWAADQDPIFKAVFYKQLLPDLIKRKKTVLVATHDDRYFHLADRLIKLEHGRMG